MVICISLHKYFAAGRGCKVLRWACLSVCLSEHLHVSKTTCPNFTRFSVHVTCGCGSAYSHSDSREGSMGSILLLIGLKVIPRVEIMMSTTALFFICLVWLKCLMPILCRWPDLVRRVWLTCEWQVCVCVSAVKRYSMALHAGELQTLSIFELLEYIVSEVSVLSLSTLCCYFASCALFFFWRTWTFAVCYRPSVCRLSFVRPTHAVQIFHSISTALVPWPSIDIHWKFHGDCPRGTSPPGELNTRGVVKYSLGNGAR